MLGELYLIRQRGEDVARQTKLPPRNHGGDHTFPSSIRSGQSWGGGQGQTFEGLTFDCLAIIVLMPPPLGRPLAASQAGSSLVKSSSVSRLLLAE